VILEASFKVIEIEVQEGAEVVRILLLAIAAHIWRRFFILVSAISNAQVKLLVK
jgi:hypothetical protein